ncbi:hypothetical protein MVEN_02137600 [Mycena venus]|uniref:Proteophosphoglycan 5 n=1 Tax=Mycena venus TaxID=2733690 RepID=A0A8H6XAL3_9AGAR|nr:hypothetical protein MVEN_02137600 [Mycena venus]
MLRSRSRSFGFPSPSQKINDSTREKYKNPPIGSPSRQVFAVFCRPSTIYKILLLSVILLAGVFIMVRSQTSMELQAVSTMPIPPSHEPQTAAPSQSLTSDPPSKRLVPFVDRSILQRLADMEISPDPDERPYFASSPHRPPMVTRIPEAKKPHAPPPFPDLCGSRLKSCRFLLPFRIGEQESKARIHFMEMLQLANRLDRILVLPNVGKSRIGACFKSDFEMYYDVERLADDLALTGGAAIMKLDLFRRWVNAEAPSAQLGFLSAKQASEPQLDVETTTFSNEDASILVGSHDSNINLPGCVARFHGLRLDTHAPLHIYLKPRARPSDRLLHRRRADATRHQAAATSPSSASPDPAVLVLSWDLRAPIFPATTTSFRPTLHYAQRLYALAAALAPPAPYAAVHWRMESVSPTRLPGCAHALIDTLTRLPLPLPDTGVRTFWFASDYPHAVHRTAPQGVDYGATPGGKAKSGTFRDVGPLHAEAVGIFGDAFAEGGELEGWEVAELTDARVAAATRAMGEGEWDRETEMLEDAGVRAIVDKIIGMRAALFVSGAPGCARTSSFTRQVLDARRTELGGQLEDGELPKLQNLVELFG